MKKSFFILNCVIMFIIWLSLSCTEDHRIPNYEERIVIANRGGSSISFVDANSDQVIKTLTITGSEPMYVVYVAAKDKLYVGDRAGKKVHVVNPQTKEVENAIPVGNGVFHMWADALGKQLWVNNDIDNTISVINLTTDKVETLIKLDEKPHDVFLTKDATKAYVSILNPDAATPDKIVLFSMPSFKRINEVNVGKDPHLFHLSKSNKLVVPCQSGQVFTLNGNDLNVLSTSSYAGAHGIFPAPDENTVFVTNITGAQIYSINPADNIQNRTVTASLTATPHNVVANEAGSKLFVTHSGAAANTVSTYTVGSKSLTPGTTITVGTNPFGLAYYKREAK
ncbi:YncE family protein [Arsenicibacter rosenii]|uniref:YNCE-like beta-propeller domain-containing protein n=1 Tax=Arsenicibacter rosenii TaxID=1750698 RepID=A0A1S2VL81_9BACT|nr:hypothetical protein [Arsenicibacter rosenii]OIN59527.1 hypothetical protein BLX24_10075 [Arsenicibacter rosenii]